jgi:hypothetical protein
VRLVARNLLLDTSGVMPFAGDDRREERRAFSRWLRELELVVRGDFGPPYSFRSPGMI